MKDPGETAVEDQQGQDNKRIGKEFLMFQQPGNDQVGIDIIKRDQQGHIDPKEYIEVSLEGEILGPGKEYKRQQEETDPGRQMNDDLYDSFIQGLISLYDTKEGNYALYVPKLLATGLPEELNRRIYR